MNSPILILANLLILMMVFLVVPVWIIVRLKQIGRASCRERVLRLV